MKGKEDWTGKYRHYTEVPGADDGTNSYRLEIRKSRGGYAVAYSESSMRYFNYKATGRETKTGTLEAFFKSLDSNLTPTKNFKPGDHMFTLKRVPRGVKLDWELVPGDDLRKPSVTLAPEAKE